MQLRKPAHKFSAVTAYTGSGDAGAGARIVARDAAIACAVGSTLHATCVVSALTVNTNGSGRSGVRGASPNAPHALACRSTTNAKHARAAASAAETRDTGKVPAASALYAIPVGRHGLADDARRAVRAALTEHARAGIASKTRNAGEDSAAVALHAIGVARSRLTNHTRALRTALTVYANGP